MDNHTKSASEPQAVEDWYMEHDNIANLADYLAERDPKDAAQVAHMVGKPWHYTAQYKEMLAAQFEADNALKIEAEV